MGICFSFYVGDFSSSFRRKTLLLLQRNSAAAQQKQEALSQVDVTAAVSVEKQEFLDCWRTRKHLCVLVCRLGFSVLVYGLGSKKALLEDFRTSHLAHEIHLVVNGFFPSITLKTVGVQSQKSDQW